MGVEWLNHGMAVTRSRIHAKWRRYPPLLWIASLSVRGRKSTHDGVGELDVRNVPFLGFDHWQIETGIAIIARINVKGGCHKEMPSSAPLSATHADSP